MGEEEHSVTSWEEGSGSGRWEEGESGSFCCEAKLALFN